MVSPLRSLCFLCDPFTQLRIIKGILLHSCPSSAYGFPCPHYPEGWCLHSEFGSRQDRVEITDKKAASTFNISSF